MDFESFYKMSQAVSILQAQDTLRLIKASTYPKMSKTDKKKHFEELKKQAYPSNIYKGRKIDASELSTMMGQVNG